MAVVAGRDQCSQEMSERAISKLPPKPIATALVAIGWPVGYFLRTMLDSAALNAAPSINRSAPTAMFAFLWKPIRTMIPAIAITAPTRPRTLKRSTPCATARRRVIRGTDPMTVAATPVGKATIARYAKA